jgi:tetratricopeptide (TPR) repeat protein
MQRYIRLVPTAADPRASYADLLFRAGQYTDALEQYRKSLEIKPDYWYAHSQIGRIYTVLGRLNDAGKELVEGLTVLGEGAKREASELAVGGTLYFLRGEYEKAFGEFQAASRKDSTNYYAAYGVVKTLSKLHKFSEANEVVDRIRAELWRRNLSTSVVMLDFYLMRASILSDEGKLDDASMLCDSALAFSTPFSRTEVFRELAEISLKQKEHEAAFMACDEALRLNPNQPEVLFILVKLYNEHHDSRMREEIGRRLLDLWRDADPDFLRLKELRALLGGKSAASRLRTARPLSSVDLVDRISFAYLTPAFFHNLL